MQMMIYLLCFLQFGELTSGNKPIFTVLFAMWRAKRCKQHIFAVLFAIWTAIKCRVAHCPKGIFGSLCSKGIGSLCPRGKYSFRTTVHPKGIF